MNKSVYDKVEDLYDQNLKHFKRLENIFENDFNIGYDITRSTVKRMLVESFNYGQKEHLTNYSPSFKKLLFYYIVMIYFLFMSFFGKRKKSVKKFDVLLENWSGNNFEEFYKRVYNKIFNIYRIAVFDITKEMDKKFFPENCLIVSRNSNHKHRYSNIISLLILKKQIARYFEYQRLSQNSGIDIINISLRLQRYIAVYNTDTYDLNSKFLISASDNHYNAMRYFIYKKNGINNILLIQNGIRTGEISNSSGDMYTYCDYYLGFGETNIKSQKGMYCPNKLPIGSLRLYDNIRHEDKSMAIEFDVIFIEQLSLLRTVDFNVDRYMKIIDMLCKFAISNKNYKLSYKTRPNRLIRYSANQNMLKHINDIDNKLKEANILIDEKISKNSYEAILKSNVIVYYNSTMGFEAIGLNKKVLCCNLDKQNFQISTEDEIGSLVDDSYDLFEKKLIHLLNNDNEEIRKYYEMKKLKFMNLKDDPVEKMIEILKKNINK